MAVSPLLDLTALTAPISDSDPAGAAVPFHVREQLEAMRIEVNPDDYDPEDPTRPTSQKRADWNGILQLARETLTTQSKDLLTAARLTEALVKVHGFTGLRAGLQLLRELVSQCWDRLYPVFEDGDLEVRAGPFNWLDDADYGARFPTSLRAVPVVHSKNGNYSWLDWRRAQDGKGTVRSDEIESALKKMPRAVGEQTVADLGQCLEELTQLTGVLEAKMGPVAPSLNVIRKALEEIHQFAQQVLQRLDPAEGPEAASDPHNDHRDMESAAAPRPTAALSRAEAYRQIEQAAVLLQKLEPHSPIPYLIQRAVKLGALPFPDLIKQLIRDDNVLSELNRELGIREASE